MRSTQNIAHVSSGIRSERPRFQYDARLRNNGQFCKTYIRRIQAVIVSLTTCA